MVVRKHGSTTVYGPDVAYSMVMRCFFRSTVPRVISGKKYKYTLVKSNGKDP